MKKTWLLRVSEFRQDLLALDVPVLDRPMFERLFHLRRRRALQLMNSLGGYQTGQALLIERVVLLRQLEALEAGAEFAIERGRQQRLQESLERIRRHRAAAAVRIPVPAGVAGRSVAGLPEGICLAPGSLHVNFTGAEDLLAKLYGLAQAAGNDFEDFKLRVEGSAT
jgi:hypothetical protein